MVRREHFIVVAGGVWGLLGRAVCDRTPGSRAGAGGRRRRPSAARLAPCLGPGFGVRLWCPAEKTQGGARRAGVAVFEGGSGVWGRRPHGSAARQRVLVAAGQRWAQAAEGE